MNVLFCRSDPDQLQIIILMNICMLQHWTCRGSEVLFGSGPDKAILQKNYKVNISCSQFEHEICFCGEFSRMWFWFWFWSDGSSDLQSPSLSCSSSSSSSSADGGKQLPVSMSHRRHTGSDVSGGKETAACPFFGCG